jgi:signal peptidase I
VWTLFAQQDQKDLSTYIDQLARTPLSKVIIFVAICSAIRLAISPWLSKVPIHQRMGLYNFGKIANEALDAIIYAGVFVFLLIRPFCIQAFKIPSESMVSTLLVGDFIVANKAIYRYSDPKIGDIVVFQPPKWGCLPNQLDSDGDVNVDFIKRCVGKEGDVVEVRHGTLYRNGAAVPEPYLKENMDPNVDYKLVKYHAAPGVPTTTADSVYWPVKTENDFVNSSDQTAAPYRLQNMQQEDYVRGLPPVAIPKGYFLFMGDNRNNSDDGRAWGLIPKEDIIGRSEFIWFPLNRIRLTR